jgi:GR25 family glycosyltransferase involved in LPS biosynthesis
MTINIFNIPLYYISFVKKDNLEKNLKNTGFTNINWFKAVDGRKLNPEELVNNNIISPRSYTDIILGRSEHSGIPSLNAIGCSLSHYNLWKKCVKDNLPYITILEDDVNIEQINSNDIQFIQKTISQKNGIFISPSGNINNHNNIYEFIGTHFYIASQNACKQLIEYMFPIDIQVDSYMAHLKTIGKIDLDGYSIIKQNIHFSNIQDLCIHCILPKNPFFYICLFLIFIIVIFLFIYYLNKYKKCSKSRKNK